MPYLRELVLKQLVKGKRVQVNGCLMYGEVMHQYGGTRHVIAIHANDIIFFNDELLWDENSEEK